MSGIFNTVQYNGIGVVDDDEFNSYTQVCSTGSQLRSFVGIVGMAVVLLGVTARGDGLGGIFYWANGSSFTDDNLNVIVPPAAAGEGAWLRNAISGPSGAFLPLAGGTVVGPTTFTSTFFLPNLPTSDAGLTPGSGQLWLNGRFVCAA